MIFGYHPLLLAASIFALGKADTANILLNHIRSSPPLTLFGGEKPFEFTKVDYGNDHPFERHRRRLADEEDLTLDSTTLEYAGRDEARPIRIKFVTDLLKGVSAYDQYLMGVIKTLVSLSRPNIFVCCTTATNLVRTDSTTCPARWAKHLSLYPVQGKINFGNDVCQGLYINDNIPSSILEQGVSDADLVVIVSNKFEFTASDGEVLPICGAALAVAGACVLDQFDRPVVGLMNFCFDNILLPVEPVGSLLATEPIVPFRTEVLQKDLEATIAIAVHELGHVLGFLSNLFPFFRNPATGEPLTPRPLVFTNITCAAGSQPVFGASENVVRRVAAADGEFHYNLVTPRVRTVARNLLNCQSLAGARLENQPSGGPCLASHWDERLFFTEVMATTASSVDDILTPLTLALMEDTGWYKVSYDVLRLHRLVWVRDVTL